MESRARRNEAALWKSPVLRTQVRGAQHAGEMEGCRPLLIHSCTDGPRCSRSVGANAGQPMLHGEIPRGRPVPPARSPSRLAVSGQDAWPPQGPVLPLAAQRTEGSRSRLCPLFCSNCMPFSSWRPAWERELALTPLPHPHSLVADVLVSDGRRTHCPV